MTEIVAAHLERVARELAGRIRELYRSYDAGEGQYVHVEDEVELLLAAALAACAREEALEWDKTAQLHITRWVELEWRNERLAALEAAANG